MLITKAWTITRPYPVPIPGCFSRDQQPGVQPVQPAARGGALLGLHHQVLLRPQQAAVQTVQVRQPR